MKKTAAILLLLVFTLNFCGYRLMIAALSNKADHRLEALIDNNEYNDSELTELRVQLNMPYQYRYTDFERHYGQITIDGKEYTYVKRKVEGDVLVLKCLPNETKTQLNYLSNNIAQANSSQPQQDAPVKSAAKIFNFECEDALTQTSFPVYDCNSSTYLQFSETLNDTPVAVQHQPPRHAC